MPDKNILQILVGQDNRAIVICPRCKHQETIQIDSPKEHKRELQVKCICKNLLTVNLEFRNQPRIKKNLVGTYINNSQKGYVGSFTILNISVSGVGFSYQDAHNFKEGDRLSLKFNLSNGRKTEINKEVTVRYVSKGSVGCEFLEKEKPFESPLGLFVMTDW